LNLSNNYFSEVNIALNTKLEELTINNNDRSLYLTINGVLSINDTLKEVYLNNTLINSMPKDSANKWTLFQKYAALEVLEAKAAALYAIDLSNNAKLKVLDLSDNTDINSDLDLSKNVALEKLILTNCHMYNGIDVSKNVNLKVLKMENADSDEPANLSFSANTKLEELNLVNTNLASIDLAKNTALKILNLASNNLDKIDLSKNANLTELSLASNKLTSIDLSKNTKLTNLYLQSNQIAKINLKSNPSITSLNVSANKLKSLDLSKQTALTALYINNNEYSQTQYMYKGEQKNVANPVTLPTHISEKWKNYSYQVSGTSVIDVAKGKVTALSAGNGTITIKLMVPYTEFNKITAPSVADTTPSSNTTIPEVETSTTKPKENENGVTTGTTEPPHVEVYNAQTTVKVVELTSDVYRIDEEKGYIYIEDENSTNTILDNIKLGIDDDNVSVEIDWSNNELRIVENDTTRTIKAFKIVRYISKYDIVEKENVKYIYLGVSKFEPSKITSYNCSAVLEGDVVEIRDSKGTVIDEFKLIKVSSSKYSNLNNGIYEGTANLVRDDIKVTNGVGRIANGNFVVYLGTEEKDENIVARIPIIGIDSSKYDLTKEYIYLGTETFDVSKITVNNGQAKVENNQLKILNKENVVLDTFDLISISSSKYGTFLSENYIYVGIEEFNVGSIALSGNAEKEYKDNVFSIKYENTTLATYDIKSIKFNNLKVTGNNIYISNAMSYGDFTKNIVANGINYKLYDGSTLVNSGNINKDLTLKVYVGTKQVNTYSIIVELFEVDKDVILDETNKLVKYLPQGLTVKNLKDKIATSGSVVIKGKDNATQADSSLLKTGQQLVITMTNKTYIYTIVVKGDVTGDGKIDINDVSKTYNAYRKDIILTIAEREAGNVAGAQEKDVDILDVSLLYNYVRGDVESLEA